MSDIMTPPLRIALVGPCSSGKSTLAPLLEEAGYIIRQPAQEHSCVPNMWQLLSKPDVLIYLDVNYEEARSRRPYIDGGHERLQEQHSRLAHARGHCDFYLDTTELTPAEVRSAVVGFLEQWRSP